MMLNFDQFLRGKPFADSCQSTKIFPCCMSFVIIPRGHDCLYTLFVIFYASYALTARTSPSAEEFQDYLGCVPQDDILL